MRAGKRQPTITRQSVEAALNTLLYTTSDTSAAVALHHLALVDDFLENPAFPRSSVAREYALKAILVRLLTDKINQHRAFHQLPLPAPNETLDMVRLAIRHDGQREAPDLIAWSLLYYDHVRVEFGITQDEFSQIAGVHPRTLHRYRQRAIELLTDELIQAEWQVRENHHQRHLLARLPVHDGAGQLIGRDAPLERIYALLAEQLHPCIYFTGVSGVGKSALLRQVARYIIRERTPDYLIWITAPRSLREIEQQLRRQLAPNDDQPDMAALLLLFDTVVVIDGIEAVTGFVDEEWRQVLNMLSFTTTLIAGQIYHPAEGITHLNVPELDYESAQMLVYAIVRQQRWEDETAIEDYIAAIWRSVGGNPRGIQLALAYLENKEFGSFEPHALYPIYGKLFDRLTVRLQFIWWLLTLADERGCSTDELAVHHVNADEITELLRHHLITAQPHKETLWYFMTPPAREFFRIRYERHELPDALADIISNTLNALATYHDKKVWLIETIFAANWFEHPATSAPLLEFYWRGGLQTKGISRWNAILEAHRHQRIGLELGYAVCQRRLGQHQTARSILQQVIAKTGQAGDFVIQAEALVELSVLQRIQGEYQAALASLQKARLSVRYATDTLLPARIEHETAQIAIDLEDTRLVPTHLQQLPASLDDTLQMEIYLQQGRWDMCCTIGKRVIQSGTALQQASAHTILGRGYQNLHEPDSAARHFETAVTLFERAQQPFALARAQSNLAAIYLEAARLHDAELLLNRAIAIQQQMRDIVGLKTTQHNLQTLETAKLSHIITG
jgi:tetratricopeptide (TPR) repeat protein